MNTTRWPFPNHTDPTNPGNWIDCVQVEISKIYEHESESKRELDIDSSEGFVKLSESFIIDTDNDSEI